MQIIFTDVGYKTIIIIIINIMHNLKQPDNEIMFY